jgi:WD40 repeat protein
MLFFSRDDENLIVVDDENRVLVWQWKTQVKEPNLILFHEDYVHTVSLCPDKHYLLTTSNDKRARVWDITTGLLVQYLPHKGAVISATFDSEGKYIATACSDHTVGIWNAHTGEQLACLQHGDRVYAVNFSKDGRYLATACDDSLVRIWLWKQDDLEAEAKLRLTGNLTREEWQEYIGNEPYRETFIDLGWRKLPQEYVFDEE